MTDNYPCQPMQVGTTHKPVVESCWTWSVVNTIELLQQNCSDNPNEMGTIEINTFIKSMSIK